MIELAFIAAGIGLGIFTGLAPGIHLNTVSIIIVSLAFNASIEIVLLIVAMAITHSFVDFIPSILLGAPEAENFLAVLPGHRLFLQGKAHLAVKLTIVGGIAGTIVSLAVLPVYAVILYKYLGFFEKIIPFVLAATVFLMVFSERKIAGKASAATVLCLSGAIGIISLNSMGNAAIFPAVTGFFGISTLLYSLKEKTKSVRQEIGESSYSKKQIARASILGGIAGAIVSFVPSVGPAQAAFVLRKFFGRIKTKEYLALLGGINASNMLFSFFTLQLIGKARTGAAAAVGQIFELNEPALWKIAATILLSAGVAAILTEIISKKAVAKMQEFDYSKLNKSVLLLLVALVIVMSGFWGLLLMLCSAATGLIAISTKTKRTNAMGFLAIPTILLYFGLLG